MVGIEKCTGYLVILKLRLIEQMRILSKTKIVVFFFWFYVQLAVGVEGISNEIISRIFVNLSPLYLRAFQTGVFKCELCCIFRKDLYFVKANEEPDWRIAPVNDVYFVIRP